MKKPIQVGITGGIGSGKSVICRIFTSLGIATYDADSRAKILMTTDRILVDQIKKEFGNLPGDFRHLLIGATLGLNSSKIPVTDHKNFTNI